MSLKEREEWPEGGAKLGRADLPAQIQRTQTWGSGSPQWALRTEHPAKYNYSQALKSNEICPARYQIFFFLISFFQYWSVYPMPVSLLYFGKLSGFTISQMKKSSVSG